MEANRRNSASFRDSFSDTSMSQDSLIMPLNFGDYNFAATKYQYDEVPTSRPRLKATSLWNSTAARIIHLILFGILLPALCIFIPVYAKYVLYAETVVSFGASDMRLVDGHISTTWCQSQNLRMNATFDAYLMAKKPSITPKVNKVGMTRHFELDDDLKEYWGFYLLKGSEVTVSSCARYLGANVMLIKGISSLKFCAYVGQESKEDESTEILGLEQHKLLEQYDMATANNGQYRPPSPSFFTQPSKKDRARILQLIKVRNEKRRIIKLLEKKHINSDRNDSLVPAGVVAQVETALQKILKQELQSLYQEVKNIIFSSESRASIQTASSDNDAVINNNKVVKDRWPMRPISTGGGDMSAIMNEEVDPEEDGAFEVDEQALKLNATTDGIADDRGTIDHNHANDTSQSDESSFSSSEEAMLHCRGVLLSQPLVPENKCTNETDPSRNVIQYVVEEDGYYYFIFSSANEKVRNQLTVKFDLLKTVFNVSDATDICHNSTDCHFPLRFYSNERVVVSLPVPDSNSSADWDRTFLAQSVCEPRMPLYLSFVLMMPLFLVLCAFR